CRGRCAPNDRVFRDVRCAANGQYTTVVPLRDLHSDGILPLLLVNIGDIKLAIDGPSRDYVALCYAIVTNISLRSMSVTPVNDGVILRSDSTVVGIAVREIGHGNKADGFALSPGDR